MPPDPFFCGSGIDRADLLRSNARSLAELAGSDAARQLAWRDGLPAVSNTGRLEWQPVTTPELFLGLHGEDARFSPVEQPAPNARAAFDTLGVLTAEEAPLFATALSLSWWHARHGFCANCGSESHITRGGWSRRCTTCSAQHFPRVDPVVIMLAEHGGRLLLGRQPQYPERRYSALAGYLEPGESIEAAVARELHEEAGIRVVDVTYIASQPWPFPSSLMVGCHARALGSKLRIDTTELEDARWFSRAEVAAALAQERNAVFQPPPEFAIARTLLERWLALDEPMTRP